MPTLSPRNDLVFKLLFTRNQELLVSLLNAMLQPASPIVRVKILDPETTIEAVTDRRLPLDVLAEHERGGRTNVEMQNRGDDAIEERSLLNWARTFEGQARRGDESGICARAR